MKRAVTPRLTLIAAAALAIAACSEPPTTPEKLRVPDANLSMSPGSDPTYVILASSTGLRAGMTEEVQQAGGRIVSALHGIGVIVATSSDPKFAAKAKKISGISDVVLDEVVQFVDPAMQVVEADAGAASGVESDAFADNESFRPTQWAPDAVAAPAAWAAHYYGAGARVAILDGGLYTLHRDFEGGAIDVARSRSFTQANCNPPPPPPPPPPAVPPPPPPPEPPTCNNFDYDRGTFWHGTHVAGIVAGRANGIGTVGIAPGATLIGVKVLHRGSGAWSWVINGMYYAATPIAEGGAGAHIINMSLGGAFYRQGVGAAQLAAAVSRAATYAYHRGVTVIASAGNSAFDFDHTANLITVPGLSTHVLTVSALGPMGWALDPTVSLDRPASYTNFGQSAIDLAAPGGDSALPGNTLCSKPRLPTGSITFPCWVFDMVAAPCRGSAATSTTTFCWAAGTSMAAPAVAGVAALIVGKYGPMHPAQLRSILERSADDLGKPGNDDYYGGGRVNAARAVQ